MGRISRLRRRRSPLYAVKETVAALNEELEFTLNYAEALTRDKSFRAAAEVIEEQRRSLVRATDRMEQAVAATEPTRNSTRIRVAIAGVAAALAIASSALAAFGPGAHTTLNPNAKIQAIQEANVALTRATGISDPLALQAIVATAQQTMLDVAQAAPSDPRLRRPLLESVDRLQKILRRNPKISATIRAQAQKTADTVKQIVVEVPDSPETSSEQPPSAPATPSAQ